MYPCRCGYFSYFETLLTNEHFIPAVDACKIVSPAKATLMIGKLFQVDVIHIALVTGNVFKIKASGLGDFLHQVELFTGFR